MKPQSLINSASFLSVDTESRMECLNEQLTYAASNSSFYRTRLSGLLPLGALSEISRLPFTTSGDIVAQGMDMLCIGPGSIRRIVSLHTSGSSAPPKRIFFSDKDLERTIDFFAEGMGWICSAGDHVGIFMPCRAADSIGRLLSEGLKRIGVESMGFGLLQDVAAVGDSFSRKPPDVLVGLPWQIRLLALVFPQLRPKAVLLSGDYIPRSIYVFLEHIWGCMVVSHFGMTETCYGCALESPFHNGLHLRQDEFYAEIIDPASGCAVADGNIGELVLTTLRREAMPLIRYRTGDLASFTADGSKRISRIYGRTGVSHFHYRLQDALCPLEWLYDYSCSWKENGVLKIAAEIKCGDGAEKSKILYHLAKDTCGSDISGLELSICETESHRMLNPNKRQIQ